MEEGVSPVTRFSVAEVEPGWTKVTLLPAPMLKPCQLITARSEVWLTVRLVVEDCTVADPAATVPPVGRELPAKACAGGMMPMRALRPEDVRSRNRVLMGMTGYL